MTAGDSEVNPALAGDRARINLDIVHGGGTLRRLMRKPGCEINAVVVEVECFETMEVLGLPVNFDEYGVFVTTPHGYPVPSQRVRADTKIQTSLSRSAR